MEDLRKKVLKHIKFARSWLEKAENEFSKENDVKGELTLTLVQAEVKHAWEVSRRAKSTARKDGRARIAGREHLKLLPGLAVIALFTAVIFNSVFRDEMKGSRAVDFPQLLANGIEKKVVEANKGIPMGLPSVNSLNYGGDHVREGGSDSSQGLLQKQRDSTDVQSDKEASGEKATALRGEPLSSSE